MDIVINELSLSGQFPTIDSFVTSVKQSIQLLDIFKSFNVILSKKSDFYASRVIGMQSIHDVVVQNSGNDTIRALQASILSLCGSEPFWDVNPSHTCTDTYSCIHTSNLCNYGLAEAVECDRVILSFNHSSFKSQTVGIKKNGTRIILNNLVGFEYLAKQLLELINSGKLIINAAHAFFPNELICKKILKYVDYQNAIKNLNPVERIDVYKTFAELIAILNNWKHSPRLSRLNNRNTYIKSFGGKKYNLEVDTQHGELEFYINGIHDGVYNFQCDKYKKKIAKRTTNYQ